MDGKRPAETSLKSIGDDDDLISVGTSPSSHTVPISIIKSELEEAYDEPILNELIVHHNQQNPTVLRNGLENQLYEHYVMPKDAVVELQLADEDPEECIKIEEDDLFNSGPISPNWMDKYLHDERDAELLDQGGNQPEEMTLPSTGRDAHPMSDRSRSLRADSLQELFSIEDHRQSRENINEIDGVALEEIEAETAMPKENDQQHCDENLVAYHPLPKDVIKEEPQDEVDYSGECHIIAYSPIPRSAMAIKEEVTDHEEIVLGMHQGMPQQEGGVNIVTPNVAPFVDSSPSAAADHAGNSTKQLRATKRKRSSPSFRPTQQPSDVLGRSHQSEQMGPSTSRNLRSRSKMILIPTMDLGKAAGKRTNADKLTAKQSDRREELQNAKCDATAGDIGKQHSSLKDKGTTSYDSSASGDVDYIVDRSTVGRYRPKKKAADISGKSKKPLRDPPNPALTGDRQTNMNALEEEETMQDTEMTEELDTDKEGFDCDKESEKSEHSSLEDLNESTNSIATHVTDDEDLIPSSKAGPSKGPKRQAQNAKHPKKKGDSNHTVPKKRPYKCSKCQNAYVQKCSLNLHMKFQCEVERRFPCTHCDFRFKLKHHLLKHMKYAHKIGRNQLDDTLGAGLKERWVTPFKCTKCGISFRKKNTLNYHVKRACGVAFHCTLCKKNFTWKNSLQSHLLHVHSIARNKLVEYGAGFKDRPIHPFKCDQCGRTFKLKWSLATHLRVGCGIEPSIPCPQCYRRFKHETGLQRHLIEIHKIERSQLAAFGLGSADRADNGTQQRRRATMRERTSTAAGRSTQQTTGSDVLGQSQSGDTGSTNRTLRSRSKHSSLEDKDTSANDSKVQPDQLHKCGKCGRTYKHQTSLYTHLKFKCGLHPGFPCSLCQFRTAYKYSLRNHLINVHHVDPSDLVNFPAAAKVARPLKLFKCEQCGRFYKSKSAIKEHLIHECGKEKLLKCPHCNFRAKKRSNLNSHVKNVHGEGPSHLK